MIVRAAVLALLLPVSAVAASLNPPGCAIMLSTTEGGQGSLVCPSDNGGVIVNTGSGGTLKTTTWPNAISTAECFQ